MVTVRDIVTAATVDSVLDRIFYEQLHPTILMVGVGMGRDVANLTDAFAECNLGEEDYAIIAVDLVSYPHASESVRKVQVTGVDDIEKNSVDIICIYGQTAKPLRRTGPVSSKR